MKYHSNRKSVRREAGQIATSLARQGKQSNKGGIAPKLQVLPQFEFIEKKYGHAVKTIGLKRVEITPLYEIEPITIEAHSLLIERSAKPKRKKNAIELIRQSFRIYAGKMSRR